MKNPRLRLTHVGAERLGVRREIDRHGSVKAVIGVPEGTVPMPPPLYWEQVDPAASLVMIGVQRSTGRLVSVALVFYNDRVDALPADQAGARTEDGLPYFDLSAWSDGVRDAPPPCSPPDLVRVAGRCRVELGEHEFRMRLWPGAPVRRVVVEGCLACEFDGGGELLGVALLELAPSDRAQLLEALATSR